MSWRMLRTLTVLFAVSLVGCSNRPLMNFGSRAQELETGFSDASEKDARATYDSTRGTGILASANSKSVDELIDQASALAERAGDEDTDKLVEARSLFQAALRQRPDDVAINHQLAIVSDRMQDFVQAEKHYKAAIRKRPRDANLLSDMGFSYFLQERYDEAEKHLQKAIAIEPGHKHAATNLGALHAAQGRKDEARSWFERGSSKADAERYMAAFFDQQNSDSGEAERNEFQHSMPAEIRPSNNLPQIVAGPSSRAPDNDRPFPGGQGEERPAPQTTPRNSPNPFDSVATATPASTPTGVNPPESAGNPFETSEVAHRPTPPAQPANPFSNSVVNQQPVAQPQRPAPQPQPRVIQQPATAAPPRRMAMTPAQPRGQDAIRPLATDNSTGPPVWKHAPTGDSPPTINARPQTVAGATHQFENSGLGTIRTAGTENPNPFATQAVATTTPAQPAVAQPAPAQPAPFQPQPARATTPDAHAQWAGMNAGPGALFPFGKARPVIPQNQQPINAPQNVPSMPAIQQVQGQLTNGLGQIRNAVQTTVEDTQAQFGDLIQNGQAAIPTANYDAQINNAVQSTVGAVKQMLPQTQPNAQLPQYGSQMGNAAGQVIQNTQNRFGQQINGATRQLQNSAQQIQNSAQQIQNSAQQQLNNFPLPTIVPGVKQN